jgi:hypothetical protein
VVEAPGWRELVGDSGLKYGSVKHGRCCIEFYTHLTKPPTSLKFSSRDT